MTEYKKKIADKNTEKSISPVLNKTEKKYSSYSHRLYRKILNKKKVFLKKKFITFLSIPSYIEEEICIRITSNNIFCTHKNIKKNQILHVGSSGKYKIAVTKKKLKYNQKLIIKKFFKKIIPKIKSTVIILKLIAPIKIRKIILKNLPTFFRQKYLIIHVNPKKCFNGCRPSKKKRKKQKRVLFKK
jgi:hypothetical protein